MMRKQQLRNCLLLVAAAGSMPCLASSEPTCPEQLTVTESLAAKAPEGWSQFQSKDGHPFVNVSFYAGSPDGDALLAPDSDIRQGKKGLATWSMSNSAERYWIACEYARTSLIVARPLAETTRKCQVEYDLGTLPETVVRWSCK